MKLSLTFFAIALLSLTVNAQVCGDGGTISCNLLRFCIPECSGDLEIDGGFNCFDKYVTCDGVRVGLIPVSQQVLQPSHQAPISPPNVDLYSPVSYDRDISPSPEAMTFVSPTSASPVSFTPVSPISFVTPSSFFSSDSDSSETMEEDDGGIFGFGFYYTSQYSSDFLNGIYSAIEDAGDTVSLDEANIILDAIDSRLGSFTSDYFSPVSVNDYISGSFSSNGDGGNDDDSSPASTLVVSMIIVFVCLFF